MVTLTSKEVLVAVLLPTRTEDTRASVVVSRTTKFSRSRR